MNPFRILLIEDEDQIRLLLEERLTQEGYEIAAAANGKDALRLVETYIFDAALMDINLPDMTGLDVLESFRKRDSDIDVVMMTGYPQVETAVQALRLGAYDYLIKPLDWESLKHLLERVVERRYLRSEVTSLRDRLAVTPTAGELVGNSPPMQRLKETITRVAPTDSVVLIEGESGTGKELIAAAIHRLSTRSKKPFLPVNCSAIPAELMESELFGHVKGAFSGALGDARGLFRSAEGGTLFLDEIGELPLPMQPKLLRVLQEREVRPVGATEVHHVDIRVVAATNQDLESAVQNGKFRQDLFYRLNVIRIKAPLLREIREDIPMLVTHIVRKLNHRFRRKVQNIAPEAMSMLKEYDFPGNVRELENIIERAYALGATTQITAADLPLLPGPKTEALSQGAPAAASKLEDLERELIAGTLQTHGNDKQKAADALGLSERTLYRRIKKLGLS